MTDVSSIHRITMVRNRLVYVLILVAITLTAMSLLSYFYVFSFFLWLFVITLFFGILGIILKISNRIFNINNPVTEQTYFIEDATVNATTEVVPEEQKPMLKKRKNVVRKGLLLASLLAWVVLFFMSGLTKLFNNDPFINLPPTKAIFTYEKHSFYALHLYRSEDQEIGFKNNPEKLPVVFTWSKPINICFNMENVNLELYIYYLDKNKQMIGKDLMTANSKNQYCPPDKISYAIESINPL